MATRGNTLAVATPTTNFGEFKPIVGATGAKLYVLETRANYSESVKFLDDAGLKFFTHQEILLLLMEDKVLKTELKRKWFYLAGKGLEENGIYTMNDKGDLVKINDEISIEKKVCARKGSYPLSLGVSSDGNAAVYGRRFNLGANGVPGDAAPVVVGKPKLSLSEQADALISKIEGTAANLRESASHDDLVEKASKLGATAVALVNLLRPTQT